MSLNTTHPRANRKNLVIGLLIVFVALTAGAVYAVLTSISVSNNVTVTPGVALGVETFTANPTSCPAVGNSGYGTVTPFTNNVAWSVPQGGSQTEYFCIENQGSGNDATPAIVLGTIPSTITCTTAPCLTLATLPATISSLLAQSVSSPIAVTLSATASTTGSGTVDIIVS